MEVPTYVVWGQCCGRMGWGVGVRRVHGLQWAGSKYRGGGKFRDGNISLWEISYFKCVRNFPLNFKATVRNKPGAKFSRAKNSRCKNPPPPCRCY